MLYNQCCCSKRLYHIVHRCPDQNHVHSSQGIHGLISSDAKSDYQVPANGQSLGQGYGDVQGAQYGSSTPASSVNEQAVKSGNGDYLGPNHAENNFQDISSQFRDALRIDSNALNQKPEEANGQVSPGEHNGAGSIVPETLVSSGKAEWNLESALLDERSLLTCILCTIPAGGRIRISSMDLTTFMEGNFFRFDAQRAHGDGFVLKQKPNHIVVPTESGCFDCNICLETAHDPVVTLCGHLYCWPVYL
ncbi:unnamed protein product [Arabidopsis lyrata]|nr:unnamed protein product [Arabidopsis lyrata]